MRESIQITLLFVFLPVIVLSLAFFTSTIQEYDEHSHGESICNWVYSDGYRHGYGNQSSMHDAIKPEYQACYDRGYEDGLADYQNNIGGQP